MRKGLIFDEDARIYDEMRPKYVPELFDDVIRFSGITENSRVLEIGAGTGQATKPFLDTGCKLTIVEPGENMAEYLGEKFCDYSNFVVYNTDFESCELDENSFDLIYSATAFHWIPPEVGYPKVMRLLKSGGSVALFWNHPYPDEPDGVINTNIQKAYKLYTEQKLSKETKKLAEDKLELLKSYGYSDIETKLYKGYRDFTPERYVKLLDTYSDHRMLKPDNREALYRDIQTAIREGGGVLRLRDTIDLYMARK